MKFEYSKHWKIKRLFRKDIEDWIIEYAIDNSPPLRDKYWKNVLNAVCRVQPSGKTIKVIYKRLGKDRIKVITAFWLD